MDLKPAWYDAIEGRTSRRRYADKPLSPQVREQLEAAASELGELEGARVVVLEDPGQTLFKGVVGGYGKVAGTPLLAAFVGRDGGEWAVGYLGQAFILEATTLGVGTCWIAGSFDKRRAGELVALGAGERVTSVTPLGVPLDEFARSERLLRGAVKASARISVEKLAPGILDADWPAWAMSAVQAARLAPSGGNRQPWRFRLEGGAPTLVMSQADKPYWTAPIDLGIARLHVELGAQHEGVTGAWELRPAPDVAAFIPG
jgi:nitroreductase